MQADLFNLSISNSFEKQAFQRSFFEKKYTLRFDQLLALGLMTIVFFVLVFAWGVEHGKAVSRRDFMLQNQILPAAEKKAEVAIKANPVPETIVQVAAPAVEIASDSRSDRASLPVSAKQPTAPLKVGIASNSKYTIAHVTYVKKDQALSEIERIKSKGYAPFLVPSGRYFQICVNGFESRKDANEAIKSLRLKGIVSTDSYIRNMPATR